MSSGKKQEFQVQRTGIIRSADAAGRLSIPKKIRQDYNITDDMLFECCIIRHQNNLYIAYQPCANQEETRLRRISAYLKTVEGVIGGDNPVCIHDGTKLDGPRTFDFAERIYGKYPTGQEIASANQAIAYVYKEAITNGQGETFHVGSEKEWMYGFRIDDKRILITISKNKEDIISAIPVLRLTALTIIRISESVM